jgi:UDP:flavonoid glycosyltransferase YjiC (YdhE family)
VVISHGGSGTVLAAYRHGIPQMCIPQLADAFLNAGALSKAHAGITLDQESADEDSVADALRQLLEEPSFRIGAQRIAAEIAAMPSPAEVAAVIESLADRGGP